MSPDSNRTFSVTIRQARGWVQPVELTDQQSESQERHALGAVAVQFFVNGAVIASVVPRLPEIRSALGVSVTAIGVMLSAAGVAGVIGSILVSGAITSLGARKVLRIGGLMLPASLGLTGFATGPVALLIGLVALSAIDVFVDVAMNMQGSWLSGRRKAPVMNRLHGLWSLGALAGSIAASRFAAAGVSVQEHLSYVAVFLAGAVVLTAPWLIDTGHKTTEPGAVRPPLGGSWTLWLFAAAGALSVALEAASLDWPPFRLADDLGAPVGLAASGYAVVAAGMTAARFLGDSIAARVGARRHVNLSLGLSAIGVVLATVTPYISVTLVGFGLLGLGNAALMPSIYDAAALAPGKPGAGLGALTAGIRVALLTVPLAIGLIAGTGATIGMAIVAITGPSVVGYYFIVRRLATAT